MDHNRFLYQEMVGAVASAVVALMALPIAAMGDVFRADISAGDISELSFWEGYGKDSLPGPEDTVELAIKGDFSATAGMSVNDIRFAKSGAYLALGEAVTNRVNALSGEPGMTFTAKNMGIRLTGGTWDFVNGANLYGGTAKPSPNNNRNIEFNGVSILNVGTFYGAYYDTKTTFSFTSGSTLMANHLIGAYGNESSNVVLGVSQESSLLLGSLRTDGAVAGESIDPQKPGATIRVAGIGSSIQVTGGDTTYVGQALPSNALSVVDGGTVKLGGKLVLGNVATSCGNILEIANGGSLSASITRLGFGDGSNGNRLNVDNGTFEGLGLLTIGHAGSGNEASIVNGAKASCLQLVAGALETSCGNSVLLSGEGTELSFLMNDVVDLFGAGSDNLISVENNATLKILNGFYIMTNSANNCLRFRNASFTPGTHFYLGNGSARSHGNRVELLDGSVFTVNSLSLSSVDNLLVVSNATATAQDTKRGIRIGFRSSSNLVSSNCTIVIQGTSPHLVSDGPMSASNFAHIHFDVPASGYADAPISVAGKFSMTKETRLTVDADDFASQTGGNTVLVRAEGGIGELESVRMVMDAANAVLPDRRRLFLSSDGREIILRTPGLHGFAVVVR